MRVFVNFFPFISDVLKYRYNSGIYCVLLITSSLHFSELLRNVNSMFADISICCNTGV